MTVVRTTSRGSEITAGGSISANAGGNLNVIGSTVAADGSVGLKATGDVTITEAVDTTTSIKGWSVRRQQADNEPLANADRCRIVRQRRNRGIDYLWW
jgi:hypothetical protein